MFSSARGDWATPNDVYDDLNEEFNFTLDVCATPENTKCERFFKGNEGLTKSWYGETCFMNPPYGREIGQWIEKAHSEVLKDIHASSEYSAFRTKIIGLLPARTDTAWFWDHILTPKYEIRLIRGRLRFVGALASAPFPSMVVIFQ